MSLIDRASDVAQREQRTAESRKRSFDKFMSADTTKLMVSMVPATNPPEALETLLKAAFAAGADAGTGDVLVQMFDAILKPRGDRA